MAKITMADGTVFEGTPAEIVEMARAFEASGKVEAEFKEGDKVLVNSDGEFGCVLSGAYGVITEILEGEDAEDEDGYVYLVVTDDDDDYFRVDDLELAEDVPLKVGDYAVVLYTDGTSRKVGEVVLITISDGNKMFPYESVTSAYSEDQLRKATDAEVSAFKAQAEADAKTEVFTSNGREVNEYREGDIVKVVRCTTGHTVGTIGEIEHGETNVYPSVIARDKDGDLISLYSYVEPIAFVENRLDR